MFSGSPCIQHADTNIYILYHETTTRCVYFIASNSRGRIDIAAVV